MQVGWKRYGTGWVIDWDRELVDHVLALEADGHSRAEIARRIGPGVTKNAVVGMLWRISPQDVLLKENLPG